MTKLSENEIATVGRDGKVKLWRILEGTSVEEIACYKEHEGFVNSVTFIPSIPYYPEGKKTKRNTRNVNVIFADCCLRCSAEWGNG